MRRKLRVAVATFLAGSLVPATSGAEGASSRAPMPEPIFAESVTDIDAAEAGELEVSTTGGSLESRREGARLRAASIEAEWLATTRLGLRLEPELTRSEGPGTVGREDEAGLGATLAWKLVRDFADDFFLQAEASADWPANSERFPSPDQPGLPFALDLRAGWRRGIWTVRGSAGAEAGGAASHVPLRASAAVLAGFGRASRTGFFGLEASADGALASPLTIAPDVVADLGAAGLPVRIGVALPWSPGASDLQPSFGVFVRVTVEAGADAAADRR